MNVSKVLRKGSSLLFVGLVMLFAVSCANDKTFEGKWKNTTQFNGYDLIIEFKGDKTGTIYMMGGETPMYSWKANFTKKTIEANFQLSASTKVDVKAKYKFTKNFKKLNLSDVTLDPDASAVVDAIKGDYEKQ